MSKAFLRESDFDEPQELPTPVALLPPGAKNYVTPSGAQRLRTELARLADVERPPLAATAASDPDSKRELQALDQRIRYLQQSLRTAEIVGPPAQPDDIVRFGATVLVREDDGTESRYRLVGADETDPEHGWVSWMSPIARALLNGRRGERISFRAPSGVQQLEIVSVEYEPEPAS